MNETLKVGQIWIKVQDNKRHIIDTVSNLDWMSNHMLDNYGNFLIHTHEIEDENSLHEYYESEFRERFILEEPKKKF